MSESVPRVPAILAFGPSGTGTNLVLHRRGTKTLADRFHSFVNLSVRVYLFSEYFRKEYGDDKRRDSKKSNKEKLDL